MDALDQALLGQQVERTAHRAQRHAMFGGQRLLGRDGAAGRPLARDDARAHGRGQRGVAALAGFGSDESQGHEQRWACAAGIQSKTTGPLED